MVVFRVGVSGDLNAHRTAVPIDHPDRSVTRVKLEYPTVDVSLAYLSSIGKAKPPDAPGNHAPLIATVDSFADKAIRSNVTSERAILFGRFIDAKNFYENYQATSENTADHRLAKFLNGSWYLLAYESVDLDPAYTYVYLFSISGSTLKGFRDNLTTPKISGTDTSLASGLWGVGGWSYNIASSLCGAVLLAPASPSPQAISILEVGVEGSGSIDDPYRPLMSRNLVPISQLSGLPAFLYRDAKKYEVLRARGFTDEEIEAVFGPIKYKVDLDAVTWGAFEFSPDKSPTVVVTVVGDNPYSLGAVERQRGVAKRWWGPPSGYNDAVELYMQLSRDFPHWLAGKDNFAYQVLGWEELGWLQNVDFYYGELVDHRTHYSQLKQVSDDEIRGRIEELIGKLSSMGVLRGERESHIAKAKEVLRRGW